MWTNRHQKLLHIAYHAARVAMEQRSAGPGVNKSTLAADNADVDIEGKKDTPERPNYDTEPRRSYKGRPENTETHRSEKSEIHVSKYAPHQGKKEALRRLKRSKVRDAI